MTKTITWICRFELCFYPRYHLDESSLLCRKVLLDRPIVMDIWQDYILVTYPPFDVQVFQAKLSGKLNTTKTPILQVEYLHRNDISALLI